MIEKIKRYTTCMILLTLGLFFISIMARFISKNLLLEAFDLDNWLVRAIWWDYPAGLDMQEEQVAVDWKKEYPYKQEDESREPDFITGKFNKLQNKLRAAEAVIDKYATDYLVNRVKLIEYANNIEKLAGWNLQCYTDYNSVTFLEDGYLTGIEAVKEMTEIADNLGDLNEFLSSYNIPVVYVHIPAKTCPYLDGELAETVDFSNQNADSLLEKLKARGVPCLDLREAIHAQGLNHHELYYITDHHWKVESGLWAAGVIADYLNREEGFQIEPELYDQSHYDFTIYPEWFLGSQGKKVTLAKTRADDFTVVIPRFETSLNCEIPSLGMREEGDFRILLDESKYQEKDVYNMSPYHAYSWGDNALMTVTNLNDKSGKSILLIHDSYGDPVAPFMALGVETLYSMDMRFFSGSLQSFIEQKQPDLVIVMYYAGTLQETVNYGTHDSPFDFR